MLAVAVYRRFYKNHLARLEENLGAAALTLSADEVAAISAAVPVGAASGTRYPAGAMKAVQV